MNGQGSLVVDELVLPIVAVRLRGAAFEIIAHVQGPTPAVSSSRYTLHDDQGAVVYRRGPGGPVIAWPRVLAGNVLTVTVHVNVAGRTSEPGPVTDLDLHIP